MCILCILDNRSKSCHGELERVIGGVKSGIEELGRHRSVCRYLI